MPEKATSSRLAMDRIVNVAWTDRAVTAYARPVDFAARRDRLAIELDARAINLLFSPPSGDLEYLTGFPRRNASFGNFEYAHQWTAGAFVRPGHEPLFVVPRGFAAFNLPRGVEGELVEVDYLDDPIERFREALRRVGGATKVAVSAR